MVDVPAAAAQEIRAGEGLSRGWSNFRIIVAVQASTAFVLQDVLMPRVARPVGFGGG